MRDVLVNKTKNNLGFTLIELLIVIAIIGILAAIAIPQYMRYRQTSFDITAKEDLANVARAEEAYYADNLVYLSCVDAACNALPGVTDLSRDVALEIVSTGPAFTGTATHPKGTGAVFTWNSDNGGMR